MLFKSFECLSDPDYHPLFNNKVFIIFLHIYLEFFFQAEY